MVKNVDEWLSVVENVAKNEISRALVGLSGGFIMSNHLYISISTVAKNCRYSLNDGE